MPPNTLMNTAFTAGSDDRIRNAFSICSGEAPPPTSRKLAGSPPASLTMSIVAMARPAPLTMQRDVAVELDVVQAVLRRLDVERILLVDVPQGDDLRMAEERVVVEVELGVQREHAAVLRDHERIDLDQRAVLGEIEREQVPDQADALLERVAGEAEPEREPARLEIGQPERRMRPLAEDLLRGLRGDRLDVHPARLRGHDHVGAARPVERHRQVELAVDRRGFLDQHRAHQDALGRRLRRLEPHPEDLLGRPLRRRRDRRRA